VQIVASGDHLEDVVIKVSDEGGGIKRSGLPRIWNYMYTTYPESFTSFSTDDSPDFR
jgi:pyruvate dehydrogenase kinase 2/3/4